MRDTDGSGRYRKLPSRAGAGMTDWTEKYYSFDVGLMCR